MVEERKAPPSIMQLRPKAPPPDRPASSLTSHITLRPKRKARSSSSVRPDVHITLRPRRSSPEFKRGNDDDTEALVSGMPEARLNLSICSILLDQTPKLSSMKNFLLSRGDGLIFISWVPHDQSLPSLWQTRKFFLDTLIADVTAVYDGLPQGQGYGAILWRRNRVARVVAVAEHSNKTESEHQGRFTECEHLISVFRVDILANDHNSEAFRRDLAFELAALFRIGGAHVYCTWNNKLLDAFRHLVLDKQVRVLVGLFDCRCWQLGGLLRSCGASGGEPISQPFRSNCPAVAGQSSVLTHPHYAVVFGPADIRRDLPEEQPQCPEYLEWSTSGLARFTLLWAHRPTWSKIGWASLCQAGASQEQIQLAIGCKHHWDFMDWPHLNKVVTKKTDVSKWQRGVHVVQFWINAKNRKAGRGARQRKAQAQQSRRKAKAQQKANAQQSQQSRNSGSW